MGSRLHLYCLPVSYKHHHTYSVSFPPSEFLSRLSVNLHCFLPPPNSSFLAYFSTPPATIFQSPHYKKTSFNPGSSLQMVSFLYSVQCQISWKSGLYLLTSTYCTAPWSWHCLLHNRRSAVTSWWLCPVASTQSSLSQDRDYSRHSLLTHQASIHPS